MSSHKKDTIVSKKSIRGFVIHLVNLGIFNKYVHMVSFKLNTSYSVYKVWFIFKKTKLCLELKLMKGLMPEENGTISLYSNFMGLPLRLSW